MKIASFDLSAMFALDTLHKTRRAVAQATERLATGKQINRASDDPSGLIAAEQLAAEQRDLEKRIEAMEYQGYSLLARDGVESAIGEMLIDLQGLVVKAANTGGLSDAEREALQVEANSIIQGIDFVTTTAMFNGQQIYSAPGSSWLGSVSGTTGGKHSIRDLLGGGEAALTGSNLELAQRIVDAAVEGNARSRGAIGAKLIGLDAEQRSLGEQLVQVSGAISKIVDTDFALETSKLVRARILEQVGVFAAQTAMKHASGTVLALLG